MTMATVEGTPFSCAAGVHPSSLVVEDATKVTVPMIILASQEEDVETIEGFEKTLKVPKYVETYPDAPHVSSSQFKAFLYISTIFD
jgi:hypothetical protein